MGVNSIADGDEACTETEVGEAFDEFEKVVEFEGGEENKRAEKSEDTGDREQQGTCADLDGQRVELAEDPAVEAVAAIDAEAGGCRSKRKETMDL